MMAADTRTTFARTMAALFSLLNNGHTFYRDVLWQQQTPGLGFTMTWVEERWTITHSQITPVRPGDSSRS